MPISINLFDLDQAFSVIKQYQTHFRKLKKYCKDRYFKKRCKNLIGYCGYMVKEQILDTDYVDTIKDNYWLLRRHAIVSCNR